MPNVFISFATEDLDFVAKFYSRLKRLGVDIWNYSNPDEEIPPGHRLTEDIEGRIDRCDYFIIVASHHSIDDRKTYIKFEIEQALRKQKKSFPVVIAGRPPSEKNAVFDLLNDRKYVEMDHHDEEDFEKKICRLCGYLGVVYQPDVPGDLRLPLYGQLQREIEPYTVKSERYVYEKLMLFVNEFNLLYTQGQWAASLETITYLLKYSRREIRDATFYFPLIAKGACELELGLVEEAKQTFLAATTHSSADESAWGGLGHVNLRLNNYGGALSCYDKALAVCPEEDTSGLLYNILATAVEILSSDNTEDEALIPEARRIINDSGYIGRLEAAGSLNGKEQARRKFLFGMAYLRVERPVTAKRYFENVYDLPVFNLDAAAFEDFFSCPDVSKQLQATFADHGFLLPVGMPIRQKQPGCWLMADGDSLYCIKKLQGSISVFYREPSFIIYFCELLGALGEADKMLHILALEATTWNDRVLFHHYALALAANGKLGKAAGTYRDRLCLEPYDKQYLVEYALFLKKEGAAEKMQAACLFAVHHGALADNRDFYYQGYGYYLLGRLDAACAFYEASHAYATRYDAMKI